MIKGVLAAAAAAMACAAHADAIEVQKIRLGMTLQEFARAYPKGVEAGITIAGASSRRGFAPAGVQFRGGRLEQFSATFAAQDFDAVRRAVTARNASVQCSATPEVAVCFEPEGTFVLSRSASATTLLLQSPRMAAEAERVVSGIQPAPDFVTSSR